MLNSTKHWTALMMALAAVVVSMMYLPAAFSQSDITVIAHSGVASDSLSKADLGEIYTNKKKKWSDGTKLYVASLKGTDSSEAFLGAYVKKNQSQFDAFWKKQVFTGKGKMPKYFKSDADMVKYVAKTKGAVGYVSSGTSLDGVKEIKIN